MKQYFTLILFILAILPGYAQTYENCPGLEWERSYGGTASDFYCGIINSNDGGYLLFGGSRSDDGHLPGNYGEQDMAVLKLDARGDVLWSRHYGGPGLDNARSALAVNGGYILCGTSGEPGQDVTTHEGEGDAWVLKVDEEGAIQWQHSFGRDGSDIAHEVQPTSDGGCIVLSNAGASSSSSPARQITRFDTAGNLLWSRFYDHFFPDCPLSLARGNTYFLTTNSHIVRVDEEGALLDSIPLPFFLVPAKIQELEDGSLLLAGNTWGNIDHSAIALRLSAQGEIIWEQRYNLGATQIVVGFQVGPEEEMFIFSHRDEVLLTYSTLDYSLTEISPEGEIRQHLNFGGSQMDLSQAIIMAADGGLLLAGASRSTDGDISNPIGDTDYWVVKLSTPPAFSLPADTTICDAEQLTLSIPEPPEGVDLLWNDGSTDTAFTASASGAYWVSASVGECRASDTIMLGLPTGDWQGLPADTVLCEQDVLLLDATLEGAALYLWQDGSQDSFYEVVQPGRYLVKIVVEDCVLEDSITVDWCQPCMAIPNAFTPNGDGINDFFMPILQCPFPTYRLQVFNRWGELIFETEDPQEGWDGAANGQPAPSEVYFYQLSYREFAGEPAKRRQGDLVLLR